MASTTNRLMSFREFEQMPDSDRRYELRHGELVEVPPPQLPHARIQLRLRDLLLGTAARDKGVVVTEFGFRVLPEYEWRIADIAFVEQEHWARLPENGYFDGAPELVIEVLSPSNRAAEIADKQRLCLANGAKEFWIVDAKRAQVRVSGRDGRSRSYHSGQQIPLLFGGILAVDEIFRD